MTSHNKLEIIISARDRATAGLAQVQRGLSKLTQSAQKLHKHLQRLEAASNNFASSLRRIAAVTGISILSKQVISIGDSFERYRIQLETLYKSGAIAREIFSEIQSFARKTAFSVDSLMEAWIRLKAMGLEPNIEMIRKIGDAVGALGGGSEKLQRIITALGQIKAKGKVSAEELMQLAEAGIPVFDILREKLHLTSAELSNIGKIGISSARAIDAILEGIEERFGGGMEKVAGTISGLFSNIVDTIKQSADELIKSRLGERIKEVLRKLMSELEQLLGKGRIKQLGDILGEQLEKAINFIQRLYEYFKPFLYGLIEGVTRVKDVIVNIIKSLSGVFPENFSQQIKELIPLLGKLAGEYLALSMAVQGAKWVGIRVLLGLLEKAGEKVKLFVAALGLVSLEKVSGGWNKLAAYFKRWSVLVIGLLEQVIIRARHHIRAFKELLFFNPRAAEAEWKAIDKEIRASQRAIELAFQETLNTLDREAEKASDKAANAGQKIISSLKDAVWRHSPELVKVSDAFSSFTYKLGGILNELDSFVKRGIFSSDFALKLKRAFDDAAYSAEKFSHAVMSGKRVPDVSILTESLRRLKEAYIDIIKEIERLTKEQQKAIDNVNSSLSRLNSKYQEATRIINAQVKLQTETIIRNLQKQLKAYEDAGDVSGITSAFRRIANETIRIARYRLNSIISIIEAEKSARVRAAEAIKQAEEAALAVQRRIYNIKGMGAQQAAQQVETASQQTIMSLEAEQKALEQTKSAWEQYVDVIKQQLNEARRILEGFKNKLKSVTDFRKSISAQKRELLRSLMDPVSAYKDKLKEIESDIKTANKLVARGNAQLAERVFREASQKISSIATEVRDKSGKIVVSQEEAVQKAINLLDKIDEGIGRIQRSYESAIDQQENFIKKLEDQLSDAEERLSSIIDEINSNLELQVSLNTSEFEQAIAILKEKTSNLQAALRFEAEMTESFQEAFELFQQIVGEHTSTVSVNVEGVEALEKAISYIEELERKDGRVITVTTKHVVQEKHIEEHASGGIAGFIRRKGYIPGFGKHDTVKALLRPGEYVLTPEAVRQYGLGFISALNKRMIPKWISNIIVRFASGGAVLSEDVYISPQHYRLAIKQLEKKIEEISERYNKQIEAIRESMSAWSSRVYKEKTLHTSELSRSVRERTLEEIAQRKEKAKELNKIAQKFSKTGIMQLPVDKFKELAGKIYSKLRGQVREIKHTGILIADPYRKRIDEKIRKLQDELTKLQRQRSVSLNFSSFGIGWGHSKFFRSTVELDKKISKIKQEITRLQSSIRGRSNIAKEIIRLLKDERDRLINREDIDKIKEEAWIKEKKGISSVLGAYKEKIQTGITKYKNIVQSLINERDQIIGELKRKIEELKQKMKNIRSFSAGGRIGVGWGSHDEIPALLTRGEFVQPVRAVKALGVDFMEAVRKLDIEKALGLLAEKIQRFNSGGLVTLTDLHGSVKTNTIPASSGEVTRIVFEINKQSFPVSAQTSVARALIEELSKAGLRVA